MKKRNHTEDDNGESDGDDDDDVELQMVKPSTLSSSSSSSLLPLPLPSRGMNYYDDDDDDDPPATSATIFNHRERTSVFFRYFFTWIPGYTYDLFKSDLLAGITVFFLLIPQGLSYAVLAGTPPVIGLYTSIAPALVYMIFGTSMQLSIGPMAITSLLISTTMNDLGYYPENIPTEVYVDICRVMAFEVGIILLLMGIFRLGILTNFLSSSVIKGFTTGSALIISVSQAKHVLGYENSDEVRCRTLT